MKWTNFLVLLFSVCVVQCWAMTNHEIEDFTNFLKKTSHLGQTLKSTPHGDDESDEDEPVSDHAWEDSGKFEGDLILNDRQRRLIVEDVATGLARNGLRDSTKRWPDNEVIYYIQREHFSGDQVQAIQDGIDDLAQASCVKFRPYKKGDRDAVVIQGSRRGCFSQVGYQGGYQVLNLSGRHPVGRGCFRHGTVVHELLHTLGFYHMQSSPDRDDYIHVAWENIIQPARHNFRKYNTFSVSDFGVGYDYDSVLHYSRKAFSANGQDTIIPKNGASIGQRRGLSDKDTQKLNKMYCDADSNDHIAAGAAADDGEKDVIKKQTPKNKPFQGHGIGYHQGKTVVIKLPAAETYYLPELPKLHMFDYFSKTPQAVSPTFTKGFGIGKEISNYEYVVPPTGNYKNPIEIQSNDKTGYVEHKFADKEISGDEKPKKDQPKDSPEHTSIQIENPHSLHKPDEVIDDAFDRLGKIIKNHVYPSQVPDLAIYKINTDYSDFYTPSKKSYNDAELKKVDSFFKTLGAAYQQKRNSPPNLPNDEHTSKEVVNDVYETIENIHNNYEELTNREETTEPNTEKEIQPIKSSFKALETFEDNKKNGHGAQQLNEFVPEFLSLKKLLKNYDYSDLYYPYSKDESESPEKQLLRLSSTKAPDRSKLDESPLPEYLKKYNEDYERLAHITPSYVLRDKARELYVPNVSEKLQYDPEQDKEKFFNFLHPQSKKNYYSGDALPEYGHHSYDYPYDSIYYVADDKKSKLR